ncbi:MAG: hypothetical protein RR255_05595 [Bacilli bacterium]
MKNISINDGVLVIDEKEVRFKYNVTHFVVVNDIVVVRLGCASRKDDINNIYGVIDGKIAWRVQDMLEYDINYKPFFPDPYSGIDQYVKEPSLLVGTTSNGFKVLINPNNGKIVGKDGWCR